MTKGLLRGRTGRRHLGESDWDRRRLAEARSSENHTFKVGLTPFGGHRVRRLVPSE
jgi:hypothetical protein